MHCLCSPERLPVSVLPFSSLCIVHRVHMYEGESGKALFSVFGGGLETSGVFRTLDFCLSSVGRVLPSSFPTEGSLGAREIINGQGGENMRWGLASLLHRSRGSLSDFHSTPPSFPASSLRSAQDERLAASVSHFNSIRPSYAIEFCILLNSRSVRPRELLDEQALR